MRHHDLLVILVELERMTALTMLSKGDGLIETTLGIGLMTIVTLQFLAVERWNVGREMAFVIELQDVRVGRLIALKLELRMAVRERVKNLGVTIGRPT